MKTFMHAYPEPEDNGPMLPFTAKTAIIGTILTIAMLLLLCFYPTKAHSQTKHVSPRTYKGHTADYAYVQKKKSYKLHHKSKAGRILYALKRELSQAMKDVFMSPRQSSVVNDQISVSL